jgi:GntR family transcriptional regulator
MYEVIHRDLLSQIESGALQPNERLDSEPALAAHYGVSRMTVRQALDQLAADHIVVRRRGSGTYVSAAPRSRRLSRLGPFHEEIGLGEEAVRTDVKSQGVAQPPDEVRQHLDLKPDQKAVRLLRLRIVNGTPAAIQESWLSLAIAPGLAREKLVGGSLYRTLAERWGIRLRHAEVAISASAATAEQAEWLGVEVQSPLVKVNRLTLSDQGVAVEFAYSWTRPEFPLVTRLEA